MAAPGRCCLRRLLAQFPSCIFPRIDQRTSVVPCLGNIPLSIRPYAAAKTAKKGSKDAKQKTSDAEPAKKKNTYRRKLASKPVDDVYLTWLYERPVYEAEVAVDMLKKFQQLDFTYPKQHVYANITLDMMLEKKKKVDQFVGTILLPYPFVTEINKVMVFTEKAEEIKIAKENGAAFAGGTELIEKILDDEINADFYIAVPEIIAKLLPLKNKLRKKFPKTSRNSLGRDIPKMLELFKTGHEYVVEEENLIETRIATLDMPNEQIVANLDAIIKDVCTYKPLSYGPFVQRLIIRSSTSEGLKLNLKRFLPQVEEVDKEDVKETEAPR
ncbi:39S ribosomal protein L1, mitochondrial [Terrapene carolina triunguis]|uniref:Large ribosomal subunit protein uL1m n=1 Tax=Terrapene triunguis TaxID=2587831 RepID=A0A674IBV7_9SAUR|nr:39S ribosomal protein L1, mitochondrial [Terrapene carolina triunguis]